MKTKLSFLALSLCLGIVLTFVLAACSTNDPVQGSGSSSSAGATHTPSSNVDNPGVVEIRNFELDATTSSDKIYISGKVEATKANPIVRIEFITTGSGWVSFDDKPVTGPITLPGVSSVQLSDARIDLMNPSIPCATHYLTVKACIDEKCSAGKFTQESKQFTKPEMLCALSSSGGEVSSSSEAVWVFAPPSPDAEVPLNGSVQVGSGSFKLSGDEGQPDMEVFGGKVRPVVALGTDDVEPGKSYSSKESLLGSTPATAIKLSNIRCGGDPCVVQNGDYYLIYLDGGDKYLVQFKKAPGHTWPDWPKACTLWRATVSP
ncbi:MAG: hypothetical protein FWF63_00055 [Fibromonadales bacterium]|nr:hypothetical protein [Fibromonadales bacterium]